MERKRWVPGEYKLVNNKRCMLADVDKNDAGEIIGFTDTIRNRIRQAAVARLGKPVSVEDIGAVINVKGPAVRAKLAGRRQFTCDDREKIEVWLGVKIF